LPEAPYRYLLRIPEQLREKLNHSAAEAGRSFNAEVRHRLEESFQPVGRSPRARQLRLRKTPNQGRHMQTSNRRGVRLALVAALAVGLLVTALVGILRETD